jgi:hypothetical protein
LFTSDDRLFTVQAIPPKKIRRNFFVHGVFNQQKARSGPKTKAINLQPRGTVMNTNRIIAFATAALLTLLFISLDASAGQKSRSGSYQGHKTSGAWQQEVNRAPGQADRSTTWQNDQGQGSRLSQKQWNQEAGTGSYSSTTTRTDGGTASRQGTVTKTGQGSYTLDGTRTGPNGRVTDVDKSINKNPDGTTSVHSAFTGPQGNTKTVDSATRKTEDGRNVTGTYSTNGGKSGSFESNVTRSESGVVKDQSLTNQKGRTWKRGINRTRDDATVSRDVTVTNPQDRTRSYSQSVTVNKP